ncbi:MAG: triose-phosphate isomerase [Tissierellia bacterium]|jgi:triosephosphate isomerase|nr:triose-phosphate isomerase [Bacillota bacterium]NLK58873.1 triose-phosphate isomerase [Tissierellia bacterium]
MKIIAGNWKMNTGIEEAGKLAQAIAEKPVKDGVRAVVCPPFTHLQTVGAQLKDTDYALGAQNMSPYDDGAYTGEISAKMLKELGVAYVILGHSERREIMGETDALVREKMEKALKEDLVPIVCVGENLEQREAGKEKDVVGKQVAAVLENAAADLSSVVIAYEPIWAIGTGKTASAEQAEEMCAFIYEQVEKFVPGKTLPVLYGGSVKPENVEELLAQPHIDGALVGGASLKADSYHKLVEGRA